MERGRPDAGGFPPMTLQRLQELLDAYGADPRGWPEEERAAAVELLTHSVEAQTAQEKTAQLDCLLDLSPSVQVSATLKRRIVAQIPLQTARVGEESQRPIAFRLLRAGHRQARQRAVRQLSQRFTYQRRVWSSLAAALLVIVGVWSMQPFRATRQPVTLDPAILGSYEMPTDILLEPPGFDLFSVTPSIGCEDSDLACPQLDTLQERQSQFHRERRKLV